MKTLGLIPARGGSKRLPRKNIMDFCGKPLIARTIEVAQLSGIDKLVCSTDDAEIDLVCRKYDCEVIKRPRILAMDDSTIAELVLTLLPLGWDQIVVLQPTSPLRSVEDINCGVELGYSISVGPTGAPNGAVYCIQTRFFRRYPYFGGQVFYMPAERSIDINTIEDFEEAERLMRQIEKKPIYYADGHVAWN